MDDFEPPKVILTADEVRVAGLHLVNFTEERIGRAKRETNTQQFIDHYGCNPIVCVTIFEDLQTTDDVDARLDDNKIRIDGLLMTLYFLKVYPTEKRREATFDLSPKTMRDWVWYYLRKIQALKKEKVAWPSDFPADDIWIISVDCTDCPIEEPKDPELTKNTIWFSFKLNGAGLRYELGIDLFESRLIWMNGPFPPGEDNDKGIFVKKGLKDKLEAVGKKALADKTHNGYPDQCSTCNSLDSKEAKKFKS